MRTFVFILYVCFVTANVGPQQELHQQDTTKEPQNNRNTASNGSKAHKLVPNKNSDIVENHIISQHGSVKHNKAQDHQITQKKIAVSNKLAQNKNDREHATQHKKSQYRNSKEHEDAKHQNRYDKNQNQLNHTVHNQIKQDKISNQQHHVIQHQNTRHVINLPALVSLQTHHDNRQQKPNQNPEMNKKDYSRSHNKQHKTQEHISTDYHNIHSQGQPRHNQHHSVHRQHKKQHILVSQKAFKSYDLHAVKKYGAKTDVGLFENEMVHILESIEAEKINATTKQVLNKYVDKLFSLLHTIIMEEDVNTISLPHELIKVRHSKHCKLTHGTLKDIAMIQRDGDVFLSYNPAEKKVTLGLPFKFNDLKVHYDYHVKSLLFKTHGGVNGFIKNARFHPVFSYYYKSERLTLDHFDMKHTGQLTVKFTGHKLIDWIINPISKAFTHVFHHKIVKTLQNHIQTVIKESIGKLNQNIAKKIHHK